VPGRLAQHAGQHGQALLADQHDLIAAFGEPVAFRLDPRDQRAGHVDDVEAAFRGLLAQPGRRAVGRDQHGAIVRDIGDRSGEDGTGLFQLSAVLRWGHEMAEDVHRASRGGLPGPVQGALRARAPRADRAEQAAAGGDRGPFLDRAAGRGHGHRVDAVRGGADGGGGAVPVQRGGDEQGRAVVGLRRVGGLRDRCVADPDAAAVQQPAHQRRGRAGQQPVRRVPDLGGHQYFARFHHRAWRQALACSRPAHRRIPPDVPDTRSSV